MFRRKEKHGSLMKPITILHTEWSDGWGGQEIRILEECLGMKARGHRVLLAGAPKGRLRTRCQESGLDFHPLAMSAPYDLPALLKLCNLLKKEKVDIIQTHSSVDSWLGGMAARLCGVACVRARHLSVRVSTNPVNVVYRLPQFVVTTGRSIAEHLVKDYGLAPDRVEAVPTGVDTERYSPRPRDPALLTELGLEPGQPVVAIVAVLRSWKRHDLFCRMAAMVRKKHPEARFLIIGNGPGWERVNGYLDEMELRGCVTMTGHREDVERLLGVCDICLLCSDKAEGVPQAVLQELSCAKAVVAAAAGDVDQVIEDGVNGLLAPPGSAEHLATGVERLLGDPELRGRLGRKGRETVLARHSKDIMLDRTEAIYTRLLAERGKVV